MTIRCSPPAFTPLTLQGLTVGAKDILEVPLDRLALDYKFFCSLIEGAPGRIEVALIDGGGKEIASRAETIRLLPANHWGGLLAVPEMLAAHVFPNDPAVAGILRKSADLLDKQTEGVILDGYQSDSPRRVATQALAIWTAILQEGIHYVNPPSSFEKQGQKVRTPSAVVSEGLGTCLDLVALGAAALEQAGLHPVIIVIQGHAFLACWLQESPLSTGIIQEAQVLRKAVRNGILLPCETTLLVGKAASVAAATQAGRERIEESDEFLFAIDLAAARNGEQIRPFELAKPGPTVGREPLENASGELDLSILDTLTDEPLTDEPPEEIVTGKQRIDQWKNKLLDLSRRNKLLNWRPTGGAMHLAHMDAAKLEDQLAAGKRLQFEAIDVSRAEDGAAARQLGEGHYAPAIERALSQGKILVKLGEAELQKNLLKLERSSRSSLEEGGANTLFIAIGFVIKPQAGQQSRFAPLAKGPHRAEFIAPLILLPVDIRRKRAGNSFSLRARDEEAVLNPTLLELLKKETGVEFPGLNEELPTDDSGLDIIGICQRVRERLLNINGWELVDGAALGEFSFAKYLMWRDLDAFEGHLRENPIVRHLIDSPREAYQYGEDTGSPRFPEQKNLDETFPVGEMLTPMSADSSQLVAVRAASQGMDFVLEGPPGTGKSQTITNIVAQCLGEGKTVLFVSEKTAALEVVHRRLKSIGLEDSVLELHSNKVSKSHVYDQLRSVVRPEDQPGKTETFTEQAAKLANLRARLNEQVTALHLPRREGVSLFQAVAYVAPRKHLDVPIPPSVDHLTPELIVQQEQTVKELSVLAKEVDPAARRALRALTGPVEQGAFRLACNGVIDQVGRLLTLAEEWSSRALGDPLAATNEKYAELAELADVLLMAQGKDYVLYAPLVESIEARREVRQALETMGHLETEFNSLTGEYSPEVMELNPVRLRREWIESEASWFLPKAIKQWKINKRLRAVQLSTPRNAGNDLAVLAKIQELRDELPEHFRKSFRLHQAFIEQHHSNRMWIERMLEFGFSGDSDALNLRSRIMAANLQAIAEENKTGGELLELARRYRENWFSGTEALAKWKGCLTINNDEENKREISLQAAVDEATEQLRHERDWRNFGLYAKEREVARNNALSYYVDSEENGLETGVKTAIEHYRTGVYRAIANKILRSEPLLGHFSGSQFDALIQEFRKLDTEFLRVTSEEVGRRLDSTARGAYRTEHRVAMGILNQELTKKRRQLPVRQLIKQLGALLPELKPCFMMSPLSIAQYLPPDSSVRFDVVVFDEASQIPVWDSIGAIARGEQTIVVGDSKQLPPTNFFAKHSDDETDYSEEDFQVETMESILDEMKAAQIHSWRLRWHYRSRAESLIAFSNRTYYDGELNTFPAPLQKDRAVGWHKVNSRKYLKGRNAKEARALVDYLCTLLTTSDPRQLTFGVVTFNQAQQVLIQDMLETERAENPTIERHFNNLLEEPLFVKNIESVQGDERDVILFSVTYGPDEAGKVYQRFGPMNATGGERRLNVAVTRARREMHIFSSIEPEEIDLKRLGENAQGARDLRLFLSFAKQGPTAFAEHIQSVGADGEYDSPFERAVAEKLRARGFETDTQVGVSGYRIDLGVRDPRRPGSYLAGIECDGASYHSTATARERDILRQSVLEGLGWTILRVWSLDWWYDADRTLEKLLEQLRDLSMQPIEDISEPKHPQMDEELLSPKPKAEQLGETLAHTYRYTTTADLASLRQEAHRLANDGEGDPFYQVSTRKVTARMIQHIVGKEGPLLLEELARRISVEGYGYSRTGSRIRKIVNSIATTQVRIEKSHGEQLAWPLNDMDDNSEFRNLSFRVPDSGNAQNRSISEVPMVELIALAKEFIPLGLDGDSLIREMGTKIGVKRVSGSSRERLLTAVNLAWKA